MTDYLRLSLPNTLRADMAQFERYFVRSHILKAYAAAADKPSHAAPILSRWFRSQRSLGSKDRRRVSDAVYDMIRFDRFLRYAGYNTPEEKLEGWCRIQRGDRFSELSTQSPHQDMSLALGVPEWMIEDCCAQIGEAECAALIQTLSQRAPLQVRSAPNRCTRAELQQALKAENIDTQIIPQTTYGLTLSQRCNLQATQAYKKGLLEIQDAASQRFCEALPIQHGTKVLDYCAGAGGKALFLAGLGAKVFIHEPRSQAKNEALKRAEHSGVELIDDSPQQMDVVLVDAPCSGTGRLRREPTLRWRYPEHKADFQWPQQQAQILTSAAAHVAPGGLLVYATCSLLSIENQPRLQGWSVVQHRQLWPHRDDCDGFAWTILQAPS